jgi:transcriptional regulator with XRE-family HTH domain
VVECCATRNGSQRKKIAQLANDGDGRVCHLLPMAAVAKIHASKQPMRPHFIKERVERRGLTQAEFAEEIGADKSQVSRWFKGQSPGRDWQEKLAAYFACEIEDLFRHPDEDWMSRFLRGRGADEIERIKQTIEVAFPRKR